MRRKAEAGDPQYARRTKSFPKEGVSRRREFPEGGSFPKDGVSRRTEFPEGAAGYSSLPSRNSQTGSVSSDSACSLVVIAAISGASPPMARDIT